MKPLMIKIVSILCAFALVSCIGKDPLEEINYKSNERAIEIFRINGQVGQTEIERTPDSCSVKVKVLEGSIDLSNVTPEIMVSIGANIEPASGETVNFAANDNKYTYTVTSETGKTREWLVTIELFSIPGWINKTWILESPGTSGGALTNYTVTGPDDAVLQYQGNNPLGNLTNHLDSKGFMCYIKTSDGVNKYTRPLSFYKFATAIPSIMSDYDNTLTFTYTGLNDDASSVLGTFMYGTGEDKRYTEYPIVSDINPKTGETTKIDFGKLLRYIPLGEGTFEYNLETKVLKLYDGNGKLFSYTSTKGSVIANDGKTTLIINNAFYYDDVNNKLQLRFQPNPLQKLLGPNSDYSLLDRFISISVPWVNLSAQSVSAVFYYQLSGTEEVWYDLKLAPQN